MDDENNASAITGETGDGIAVKQQKSPRRKKAAAEAVRTASVPAAVEKPGTKRKTYSESEKAEKLRLIGKKIAEGKSPLQEVVKSAGISVQTYYLWKRNEKPAAKNEKPAARKVEKAASSGNELAELVQLEAENIRLRGLLAEKLRAENLELRKRLGLN